MIHVGASGGVLDLVPMSSNIIANTYSTWCLDADGLFLSRRSIMYEPVLPNHACPSLTRLGFGKNDGQVALIAPSA